MRGSMSAAAKSVFYENICEQLHNLLGDERNSVANAANAAALLKQHLPDVSWVGFYFAENKELVLGPFQGSPTCARIAFGRGVCGTAAVQAKTILVQTNGKVDGPASRSEIAVPLLNWGKLRGVLNVESANSNRFDLDDEEGLESLASIFMASLANDDDLPDLSEEAAFS
jgi:L-methionine (R)-S-oxide reductase